jgi:hypothetical protein
MVFPEAQPPPDLNVRHDGAGAAAVHALAKAGLPEPTLRPTAATVAIIATAFRGRLPDHAG